MTWPLPNPVKFRIQGMAQPHGEKGAWPGPYAAAQRERGVAQPQSSHANWGGRGRRGPQPQSGPCTEWPDIRELTTELKHNGQSGASDHDHYMHHLQAAYIAYMHVHKYTHTHHILFIGVVSRSKKQL